MRKEYKSVKSLDWVASDFPGWDETTRLFKDLRNEEQHERQIHISVYETRFYKVFDDDDNLLAFSGTWALSDQLAEGPPDGMTFYPVDPVTREVSPVERFPVRVEYRFLIQPRDDKLRERLEKVGTSNVHDLSQRCLVTLTSYYEFYAGKICA
jgi:hypothetical protein